MVDANVFSEKLKQLFLRIEKARAHCPADPADLAADSDALDLVSFNLLLAVQTCLDLATHLIADESWAPAATSREAFERLEENGVISKEATRALRQGVDPVQVHAAASTGLTYLEHFAAELSAWVERRIEAS